MGGVTTERPAARAKTRQPGRTAGLARVEPEVTDGIRDLRAGTEIMVLTWLDRSRTSSSVLYDRLDELAGAGPLTRDAADAYQLTEPGAALGPALESLGAWTRRWPDILPDHSG
jgi:DNA-binding HxlR family transcriptional regulator